MAHGRVTAQLGNLYVLPYELPDDYEGEPPGAVLIAHADRSAFLSYSWGVPKRRIPIKLDPEDDFLVPSQRDGRREAVVSDVAHLFRFLRPRKRRGPKPGRGLDPRAVVSAVKIQRERNPGKSIEAISQDLGAEMGYSADRIRTVYYNRQAELRVEREESNRRVRLVIRELDREAQVQARARGVSYASAMKELAPQFGIDPEKIRVTRSKVDRATF